MSDNKIGMRSKTILSIVAFLAAFGISVALTPRQPKSTVAPYVKNCSDNSPTRQAITRLLEQDIENGRVRDRKIDSSRESGISTQESRFRNFTLAVNNYADDSASIDYSDLPNDFKTAWRQHMKAWRIQADYLQEIGYTAPKTRGKGFSRDEFRIQDKEISDTWQEVLRIARKYDANIPAGAY